MTGAQALGSSGKSSSLPNLGRFGLFLAGFQSFGRGFTLRQAKDIEAQGYGAVWVAGSPPAELDWVKPLLEQTSTLQVATGIVNINIWTADAGRVSESFHRIDKAYPSRFLLGIGAGHLEVHQQYRKPLHALSDYLDKLDEYGAPKKRRVVAAPEHKVVLTTDPQQARRLGRKAIETAIDLANYRRNRQRLRFTDDDLAKPGSDRLIDSVVAYGTSEAIAIRLQQFLDAGANRVPVQVLTEPDTLVQALAELAGPLGQQSSCPPHSGEPARRRGGSTAMVCGVTNPIGRRVRIAVSARSTGEHGTFADVLRECNESRRPVTGNLDIERSVTGCSARGAVLIARLAIAGSYPRV
ncbi:MAG: hypothetical protein QOE41_3022 [Mycobacterium sp.]|jgi:alkanesulfonate monooxygenase SsuD/methylene tetrahydromethanopterin reductase-like flavin-dependent oxidoreductase (luciferase family)|nr:hypothetical protein [Mycobacterium sp.]